MRTILFATMALESWPFYVAGVIVGVTVALWLLAKRSANIFDPVLLAIIAVGIDIATLTVMVSGKELPAPIYISAILSYLALFWGLSLVPLPSGRDIPAPPSIEHNKIVLAIGLLLIYLAVSVWNFSSRGILESARETGLTGQSASSNLVYMLSSWLSAAGAYAAIDAMRMSTVNGLWRTFCGISLLLYFAVGALGGSKVGAIFTLTGALCMWTYIHRSATNQTFLRQLATLRFWWIALLILILVFFYFWLAVGVLYGAWSPLASAALFAGRLLQNSDGIYMASSGSGFYVPAPPSLATFIDPTLTQMLPIESGGAGYSYGRDVFQRANGFSHLQAPNAKPIIVLISYLGLGSIVASFMMGVALGWLRRFAITLTMKAGAVGVPLFLIALAPLTDLPYGYSLIRAMLAFSVVALLPFAALRYGIFYRRSHDAA